MSMFICTSCRPRSLDKAGGCTQHAGRVTVPLLCATRTIERRAIHRASVEPKPRSNATETFHSADGGAMLQLVDYLHALARLQTARGSHP